MKKLIFISLTILFCFSCSDARKAKKFGRGSEFRIEMLNCDGTVARSWISTGKVQSGANIPLKCPAGYGMVKIIKKVTCGEAVPGTQKLQSSDHPADLAGFTHV